MAVAASKRGTARLVAVALVMVLVLAYLALPRTGVTYTQELAAAAQTARSAVQTALILVGAVERGQAPEQYASRALSYAEGDVQSAMSAFSGIQPPGAAENARRAQLVTALNETAAALSDLRIAARAGDLEALPRLAAPLPGLRDRLAAMESLGPT